MIATPSGAPEEWVPISLATMQHVLQQVNGVAPRDHHEPAAAKVAQGFLVPQREPLHFAAQRRSLGATLLSLVTVSAMRMRNGASIDTSEFVHVGFVLSGMITITPRGGDPVRLAPGGACAINDWRSFGAESSTGTRGLLVVLPEQALADRGVHVNAARFKLEGPRSLRRPMRGFALAIADASWNPSSIGELVAERTIEDLVVGMFLEADGYAMDNEDLRAGLRGRAISEIAASHRRTDLTPSIVARILGVSLRHLQRAFENSDESIARAITRRRTESAALLLSSPGATILTIDEVARNSGFSSAFQLRAAFRGQHGMLPSEYRDHHSTAINCVPEQT
jgi:AraC-like DNA-binding protein